MLTITMLEENGKIYVPKESLKLKKICIIHHPIVSGGASSSMLDLVDMLRDKYEVVPCILKEAKDLRNYLKSKNIPFYLFENPIPSFNYYSGSSSLLTRSAIRCLLKFSKERAYIGEIVALEPDAVIFNSVITSLSGRRLGDNIRKICFIRETFRQTIVDRIYRHVLDGHFHGVCYIAGHEQKYMNLKKTKTAVIPDCLQPHSIELFSKEEACKMEGMDKRKFNVLFMGGLDPIKGLDIVLKALCMLDDSVCLIVAGYLDEKMFKITNILKHCLNITYTKYILRTRKYYYKAQKDKKLICVGFCSEISSLMCACDVVVFPSNKAHQPRPGIEAGEYKKPVVISDYEATKEYFIDGYNAVVFKPHDAKDLARKLKKLKDDKKIINMLGENNYLMTKTEHNYNGTKIKLQEFIDKCLS